LQRLHKRRAPTPYLCMRKIWFGAALAVMASVSLYLYAAPMQDPDLVLPYRGYLEKIGQPLSGQFDVDAELFGSPANTDSVWKDSFNDANGLAVQVANGQLSLLLGSHKKLDAALFNIGKPLYLEITVS